MQSRSIPLLSRLLPSSEGWGQCRSRGKVEKCAGPITADGALCSRTSPLSHRRWDNRCAIAPIAPSPGDGDLKFL